MTASPFSEPSSPADRPDSLRPLERRLASKVPEITALFWVIKVLTTGMGEATSDFLGNTSLVLAGAVGVFGFAFALWLQFRTRRYLAGIYWFAVVMVAVFGTMAADGLHVALGIPYIFSTSFYAVALAIVFYLWRRSEGTLSIHSITTTRRETYYWATVFATFALGTAAGDLTATTFHLGFLKSGILFAAIITIPLIGWRFFGLNSILAFWLAYVATRPLGASFADWLGKPHHIGGGLGFGDGTVAGAATVAIVALVGWFAYTQRDLPGVPRVPDGQLGVSVEGVVPARYSRLDDPDDLYGVPALEG